MNRMIRVLTVSAVLLVLILAAGCGEEEALHRVGATRFGTGYDVAVADGYAYVTDNDGVVAFAVDDPRRPRQVSRLDAGFTGGVSVQDGLVFIASDSRLVIADISNPAELVRLGTLPIAGVGQGVSVDGELAYVASTGGLDIVDVSDPGSPRMVGGLYDLGQTRSAVVRESIAYLAAPDSGVHVIDVSDPSQPRRKSTVPDTGGSWDLHLHEEFLTVGCHGNGVRILDLVDPLGPKIVARLSEDDGGEAQGVWFDGQRLVIADNYSVELFDVTGLGAPLEIGSYEYRRGALHDLDVLGQYVYVAGGTEGLIILEITSDQTG